MRLSWFELKQISDLFSSRLTRPCQHFSGLYEYTDATLPLVRYDYSGTKNFLPSYGYPSLLEGIDADTFRTVLESKLKELSVTAAFVPVQVEAGTANCQIVSGWGDFASRLPSYCIDLRLSLDDLRRKVSRRRRSKLETKPDSDVEFSTNKKELLGFFLDHYPRTMARLSAHKRFSFSRQFLTELGELHSCTLLGVRQQGTLGLVLAFGTRGKHAEFVFSASSEQGRSLATHGLWHAIKLFKQRGAESLHLGGGMAAKDGLDDFKRQFGGQHLVNGGLKLIIDRHRYQQVCEKNLIDAASTSFFPAYLHDQIL